MLMKITAISLQQALNKAFYDPEFLSPKIIDKREKSETKQEYEKKKKTSSSVLFL